MAHTKIVVNVTDKHGNPMIGLEVELVDTGAFTPANHDPIEHVVAIESTDISGTATFTGLNPSMYYARPRITRPDIRIQTMMASGIGILCYSAVVDPHGRGTHTTIQSAIDALGITGGTVLICAGTYQENLTIAGDTEDLWLIGISRNCVTIQGTAASPTITVDATGTGPVDNFRLEHLTIDHTGAQTLLYFNSVGGGQPTNVDLNDLRFLSGAMGIDLTDANGGTKFTLRDLVFDSTCNTAGQLQVSDLHVSSCKLYCASDGLYVAGSSVATGIRIDGCRLGSGGAYCLRIGTANDVQVSNCRMVSLGAATVGVLAGNVSELVIDGCVIDCDDGVGIDLGGIATAIIISDCSLTCASGQDPARAGITASGYCSDLNISDCRIKGFESYGIQLENVISTGGQQFVIDGVMVKNGEDTHSISIGGWDYGTITGCVLVGTGGGNTTYGIYGAAGTTHTVIVGNVIRDHDDLTNLLHGIDDNTIDGNSPPGPGGEAQRFFDMVVAADDSTDKAKSWADYVCTGSDDDVEINAALNSAAQVRVLLMPGNYSISAMIVLSDWGKALQGSGDGVTIIKQEDGADLAAIINITAPDCSVRDLQVDGNYANNDPVSGIKIDNVSGMFIFHVQPHYCDVGFEETGGAGIWNNYTNCNVQNDVTTPYSLVGTASRCVNNFLTPDGPLILQPKVANAETLVVRNLAGTDLFNVNTAIPALDLLNSIYVRGYAGNWANQTFQLNLATGVMSIDTINEITGNAGVTVDVLTLIKDAVIYPDSTYLDAYFTTGAAVTVLGLDSQDYLAFTKGTNLWSVMIGNVARFYINATDADLVVPLDMNTHKITGVVDPTAAQEAATKAYVDLHILKSLLTTRGDMMYRNAAVPARLAIGDDGQKLASDGTDPAWEDDIATITYVIDGGGEEIADGIAGFLEVSFACTILEARLLADQTGSIVVDIWKDSYANYPPTNADTITGGNEPTIAAGVKDSDATLTDWTTTIEAESVLGFNVDSCTDIERCTVTLKVRKT